MTTTFLALAAATFVSEDLACILAGVLIYQGAVDPVIGIAACASGIYLGDLGLYVAGRVAGSCALGWPRVRRYLTASRRSRFSGWFTRHAPAVVIGSRFLPGTRLPLYVAAGALGASFGVFAWWSFVAVLLWTPTIVLLSAAAGRASAATLANLAGDSWLLGLTGPAFLFAGWRVAMHLLTRRGRQRAAAAISRVWRWEFWPMWVFYTPVAAWIGYLAIRHRGIAPVSAANPGIPDGGIVGESKHEILSRLPAEWTIPSRLIDIGNVDDRLSQLVHLLTSHGWMFPLVFKPDVGQRGAGVKIVRMLEEARDYLARERNPVLVQPYHSGPFEAGVFYYRYPGSACGRILSITDKHFPVVVGDGRTTLEDLIWGDQRLRMQAATFLTRHAAVRDRVLGAGERFPLAVAGNHCQGTLFRDGRHLITPALEARIDSIARSYNGFFIGRFDIRYRDVERFKAGDDLAIVELNGATAESTNIYDPALSLLSAYRQLFRQWSLVFAIGAANRSNGAPVSSGRRVLELLRTHFSTEAAFQIAD